MADYTSAYTGSEIDTEIGNVPGKADQVDVDSALALKANQADLTSGLATKLDKTVAEFTPQTDPGAGEGQIFYDSATHSLSVKNDQEMTLNLGAEEIIRVYNGSGSVIPNATPVKIIGAVNDLPNIAPAQADTFSGAVVPGITTHEIASGAEGFITHAGTLGGSISNTKIVIK